MMLKIIWRNIWRNKRRSLVMLSSVIVGVIAIILNDSFGNGFVEQMLTSQINKHTSHIQIHKTGFVDNITISSVIPDINKAETVLKNNPSVVRYSKRIITFGLVNSANSSSGVNIVGIQPGTESQITVMKKSVIEGKYPESGKRDILIGSKMADKLEVGIGGKLVVVANSAQGTVNSELFRVSGIYKSGHSDFDNSYIFVPADFANSLLELNGNIHEFAIITNSIENIEQTKREIAEALGSGYEVLSYKDLLPMIVSYMEVYQSSIFIFYAIIGIAVLFGVVNTMLMSVFERVPEFGVLIAIGMKRGTLFRMVLGESLVLGILGSIIGSVLGLLIYLPFAKSGIDLSSFSEGMSMMGLDAIIYPSVNPMMFLNSTIVMPLTAVIGAVYPAYKAIRLQPTEAMRHV
ncbi:MAG: FtsX-like permease family protein [Candidatus Kapabacteria bacterium]|nr:FtsX-like permease family protein [Candidatus Kapabacteria bacterium]